MSCRRRLPRSLGSVLLHVHVVHERLVRPPRPAAVVVVVRGLAHRPARKVQYALQLPVVEEVVERPQVSLVRERIPLRDRLVRVRVAVDESDDVVDGFPQLRG
eukprot:31287-Pelagococcus_subviridis.AAC.16